MPLKNKYGILKIGIEYDYSAGDCHEIDELSPDFLVTKLFRESQTHSKLLSDSSGASNCASNRASNCASNRASNCGALPCASLNTYKVDPLFGDKFEDNDIWKQNIYGFTSEWIDPDNESEDVSAYSLDALNKELQWASYISISHLIVNPPSYRKCDNFARCINANINSYNGVSIIVKVPLAIRVEREALVDSPPGGGGSSSPLSSTPEGGESSYQTLNGWDLWANFIPYCNHNFSNLSVGIELVNLQNVDIYRINLDVWKSEPVKLIFIPLNVFAIDSKTGYPYLPKKLKDLLVYFFRKNIEIVLTGRGKNEYPLLNGVRKEEMYSSSILHSDVNYLKCCIYYLKRLFMSIENFDNETLFDNAYWDYLQIPLQPLKDNLPSQTYEIFEKDRTKYEQYELAISKYLSVELQKGGDNNVKGKNRDIVIFVVGAGRGPLVDCTLQALEKNKISKFQIYAIEKNDSAILVLQNRATNPKWKQVNVIHSDMRYLEMEKRADLIVSELLGSFGDNELFPECLDGIQKYLQEDGVSIPNNCISYMEPISCSQIYHKIGQNNFKGYNEIFYIVNMYSYCKISDDEPAECFTFQVPNKQIQKDNSHNNRYKRLSFTINMNSYLHGFLCYFKSQLYEDVYLSIEPNTHTKNLHSWYPLYIPINQILFLEKGDILSISIWRLTDSHKIWYEWCVSEPQSTCIHNYNARHFSIGR